MSQREQRMTTGVQDVNIQGSSGIEMQSFIRCDTMKCREVAPLEEVKYAGTKAPISFEPLGQRGLPDLFRGAIDLHKVSTLRMCPHRQILDPIICTLVDHHHQSTVLERSCIPKSLSQYAVVG
jgi:hypothetical protein